MKKEKKQNSWFHLPKPRWKWIAAWLGLQPFAAAPLVMMVMKMGPFKEPFIANGPVVMPAMLLAVAPVILLIQGSGFLDPVPRDD
jgi:hypothetical protein